MAETTPTDKSSVHTQLVDALPVVTGSITSRVLVNNPLLRVTHFTLDEGEQLTEHTSPRAVVVQLLEGDMVFTLDGEESALKAGDVVYLAPGVPHALRALVPCRMALVMVDLDGAGQP